MERRRINRRATLMVADAGRNLRSSADVSSSRSPAWRLPRCLSDGQAVAGPFEEKDFEQLVPRDKKLDPEWVRV